jgi:hypothetical protein
MLRTISIGAFAVLLAMAGIQSANAFESASKTAWAQAQLACADVGIAPGSGAFGQCVVDLYYSVWNEEYETER